MITIDKPIFSRYLEPGDTNFLAANVLDKIKVTINFEVDAFAVDVTDEQEIIAAPSSSVYTTNPGKLIVADSPVFNKFKKGDVITILGTVSNNGSWEIVKKYDDNAIEVESTGIFLLTNESFPDGSYMYANPGLKAFTYDYNFVENGAPTTFDNPFTGITNRLVAPDITVTGGNVFVGVGKLFNQQGDATISELVSSVDGRYKYQIIHNLIFRPYLTQDELDSYPDLDDFLSSNCLKFVCRIRANKSINDPATDYIAVRDTDDGNTGLSDENFNGNVSDYFVSDQVLKHTVSGDDIPGLPKSIHGSYLICNINDKLSRFNSSTTNVEVSSILVPTVFREDLDLLDNTNYNVVNVLVGAGTINSNRNSTEYQFIKSAQLTYISPSQVMLRVNFEFFPGWDEFIDSIDPSGYLVNVSVHNVAGSFDSSNAVRLPLTFGEFYFRPSEITVADIDSHFATHVDLNPQTDGSTSPLTRPGDELISVHKLSFFSLPFGKEYELKDLVIKTMAIGTLGHQIELSRETIDLSDFQVLFGTYPAVNKTKIISIGSYRRELKVYTGNFAEVWVQYPFINRFEYWRDIKGVKSIEFEFLDMSQPNNGLNHYWYQLIDPNAFIFIKLEINTRVDGVDYTQEHTAEFFQENYDVSTVFLPGVLKSFEDASELTNGSEKFLTKSGDTIITFESEYTGAGDIVEDDFEIELFMHPKESGGIENRSFSSSLYSDGFNGYWKTTVSKSVAGNIVKGTALISKEALADSGEYTVYGRIYLTSTPVVACEPTSLDTESGDCFLLEQGGGNLLQE